MNKIPGQKNKISCLQELFDWIEKSNVCLVSEKENDYFRIEAPNNADVFVNIENDDDIEDIISRTIERLDDFDADERFMELWSKEFSEHNHFKPSRFIKYCRKMRIVFGIWRGN
ncbi:MAG: hypothetical protein LBQ28_07020 [Prevotellaceae bacterium]|jgi:hypothetical protein|nr:hypothetical protein [Prevotellaceae bacterium]